jgi:hypothetical protein
VAHPLDLHFHHLELDPHLGLVEMLDLKMMVDLVLMEALRIPWDTHLSHPFLKGRAGCIAYVCQDLFPHIC